MIDETLDSLKSQMGHIFVSEEDYEIGVEDEDSDKRKKLKSGCIWLDYVQRMVLGIGFLVAGLLLLSASPFFIDVPADFVWVDAFANAFVLASCVLVLGVVRQFRVLVRSKMRLLAVVMYVVAMVAALTAALEVKSTGATVLFVAVQVFSALWYLGPYIPYLKTCVSSASSNALPM